MTYNRGKLLREAMAGRLVLVSSYSFDDMHGSERTDKEMPVAMAPEDWKDRKPGICYLRPDHFKGNAGMAYVASGVNSDKLIHLKVHSNLNYTFRVLPKPKKPDGRRRMVAGRVPPRAIGRNPDASANELATAVSAASNPVATVSPEIAAWLDPTGGLRGAGLMKTKGAE